MLQLNRQHQSLQLRGDGEDVDADERRDELFEDEAEEAAMQARAPDAAEPLFPGTTSFLGLNASRTGSACWFNACRSPGSTFPHRHSVHWNLNNRVNWAYNEAEIGSETFMPAEFRGDPEVTKKNYWATI